MWPEGKKLHFVDLLHHLPAVEFNASEPIYCAYGLIRGLPFQHWAQIEGHASEQWEKYYGQENLAFGRIRLTSESKLDEQQARLSPINRLEDLAHFCWLILSLTYSKAIPHPDLSMRYIFSYWEDDITLHRRIDGKCDFDLLRARTAIRIEDEHSHAIEHNANVLDLRPDLNAALESLVAPFRTMSTFQFDPLRLFLFVSETERMVNPDGNAPLNRVYASRMSSLTALDDTEWDQFYSLYRNFYSLRSLVSHGKEWPAAIKKLSAADERETIFPVRTIRRVTEALLIANKMKLGLDDLVHQLLLGVEQKQHSIINQLNQLSGGEPQTQLFVLDTL